MKCVLVGGVETNFEHTNVGPNEVIREDEDSGAIGAKMMAFGQDVRFQVTPTETSQEPSFQVYVYDEQDRQVKLKSEVNEGLSLEVMGINWIWIDGGNYGNISYTIPTGRDSTYGFDAIPIYFKYVEFRFTVPVDDSGDF